MNGLDLVDRLKTNDRFDSYKARFNGQKVFAKHAKSEKTKKLLANQIRSGDFINSIGVNAKPRLRAPKVIASNQEWLVTEWLQTESIGRLADSQPQKAASVVADFVALFDNQPSPAQNLKEIFTIPGISKRINERLAPKLDPNSKRLVESSLSRFTQLSDNLKPAWQDADIKPYHLYPQTDDSYVLIDSEHLGPDWPRYYDVANNFAKYWVRDNLPYCKALISETEKKLQPAHNEFVASLTAILIVRGLSILWSQDYESELRRFELDKAYELLRCVLSQPSLEDLIY